MFGNVPPIQRLSTEERDAPTSTTLEPASQTIIPTLLVWTAVIGIAGRGTPASLVTFTTELRPWSNPT